MNKKVIFLTLLFFCSLASGYAQLTEATVPYFQGFENWIGGNFSHPDASWTQDSTTGDDSWRREDQGTTANWDYPTDAPYSPASTQGSHSARFHSSDNLSGSPMGYMDLHIDFSATGTKLISFDYINADQNNTSYMEVLVSTDSISWTLLGTYNPTMTWKHEQIAAAVVSPHAILRFEGFAGGAYGDMGIDSLNISMLPSCNGTPVAGAISASQPSGCTPYISMLSLAVDYSAGGYTYQWQSSTNGTTYTNVIGATATTYTAYVTANIYYRVVVTCTNGNTATNSAPIELHFGTPTPGSVALPYFQGFESWIGTCFNYDRPDSNWITSPSSGDNSWRRDDQGADAGWDYPGEGTLYPPFPQGAHYARFHSSENYGDIGVMDLYVNLTAAGTKLITFDYDNADDNAASTLTVSVSTNNGSTWTQLGQYGTTQGWTSELITTTATGPQGILRFEGISAGSSNDMGIDSLNIILQSVCTGTPVAGTISATQASGCSEYTSTLSLPVDNTISGIAYQWQSSTNGSTYTNVTGATNSSYTADVTANVYYQAIVTCTNGNASSTTAPIELVIATPVISSATLPYFQGFENWIGACFNFDRPDAFWSLTPSYGDNSWRRDDQGSDAAWDYTIYGGYTPASTEGAHSARFHSFGDVIIGPNSGSMDLYIDLSVPGIKLINFDYNNMDPNDGSYLTVLISTDSINFTQLAQYQPNPNADWIPESITTNVTSHAIIRFQATATVAFNDIGIDSLSITNIPIVACSGSPAVGVISPASAAFTPCSTSNTQTFTLSGFLGISGLTYQWETNTGSGYIPVTGATNATYTGTFTTASTSVNCIVTCTASGLSTTSGTAVVTNALPSYATLPYTQGFENQWINKCDVDDVPDNYWTNNPVTGDNAWRRDDDGASANWFNTDGGYTPTGSDANGASSAHSARFHTYATGDGTTGTLDLYLDLSGTGTKQISYDYINATGTDNVTVLLSTTGPTGTFTQLDNAILSPSWTTRTVTTTATSATCVLRFLATSDDGNDDMGIDNVSVSLPLVCSGTPAVGTIAPTTATLTPCTGNTQFFTLSGYTGVSGLTYQWEINTGTGYTPVTGATGTTFTGTFTAASTTVNCIVTCTASGMSTTSTTATVTYAPQAYFAVTTANAYTQGFENTWLSKCDVDDAPDTYWLNTPATGNDSWRRDDDGSSAIWNSPNQGGYTPTGSNANGANSQHSARFDSWDAASGTTGTLDLYLDLSAAGNKQISYDYINHSGADNVAVMLSTTGPSGTFTQIDEVGVSTIWATHTVTTTTTSATCVLRFLATSDDGDDDMGLDNVSVQVTPPPPPCDTVTNLAATGITQTGANITWTAVGGSAGYEVIVATTTGIPVAGGSTTNNSYPVTGLTANTTYYVIVRDSCGVGNFSAWDTISFTTSAGVACDTVTGVTVTGIGQTSATVSWNAVTGTAGYEIVVGTLPSTIIVNTSTTNTTYLVTGLTANTTYYVLVRDSCGVGNFSAWDTVSFTTHSQGIANINGNSQFSVDAYPNPANDIVTVRAYGITGDNRKVSLTDVAGRTISVMDMATDRVDFNMSNLAPGIYLVRYEDDAHTRIIKVNKQ